MKILVTGGAGYIGSHTIIELLQNNYVNIASIDNYSNSSEDIYSKIKKITNNNIVFFDRDVKDQFSIENIFEKYKFDCIIHFAAYKYVNESMINPKKYYDNNINGLLNILNLSIKYKIKYFIFSSSCSVYGDVTNLPINENTNFNPKSIYAHTKQICEEILVYFSKIYNIKICSLRYFNPIGIHSSNLIGEKLNNTNIIPCIVNSILNKTKFKIYGNNYNTIDGTCIRDYIHVSDISNAHVKSIDFLKNTKNNYSVFNLGLGYGLTILEIINIFKKYNIIVNYEFCDKRLGDVEQVYSDNNKAIRELNWNPHYTIDDAILSIIKFYL